MTEVQFNQTNSAQHKAAAEAFIATQKTHGVTPSEFLDVFMDISAADGVNGNAPIDWERMFALDQVAHDVGGIHRHMDRETGELGGMFLPRCTVKEATQ
jgi:hypothetical protein